METTPSARSEEPDPVRLLIVSDIKLHREALALCLAGYPTVAVVEQASNSSEAMDLAGLLEPEVILLDMGSEGSLALAADLHLGAPSAQIIAYGLHDLEHEVVACAEAGMAGCFPCDGSVSELAATVVGSRRDEVRCSPKAAAVLFRRVAALARQVRAQENRLTGREAEIVSLIERRLSNKEIAQRLNLEVATVKNHVHNILEKLQVSSRHQVVRPVQIQPGPRLGGRAG